MEETVKKPKSKAGKIIKIILLVLLGLVVACLIAVYALWHNEIGTVLSIKQLSAADPADKSGATYYIDMKGGYYFDDYLAQGGCATDSDLVDFIVSHITHGMMKLSINPGETGCASFTATTEDGDRLMARNYDMRETGTAIVHCDPGDGRHESYSTIDFRFISVGTDGPTSMYSKILSLAAAYVPMDGMNDAGVAAGIYMSYQGEDGVATDQNTDLPDITSSAMVRLILDYADNVDEAIELVKQYDLHDSAGYSYHYMVADAEGNSAVLEWINDTYGEDNDGTTRTLHVTYNDDSGYQTVTNYIVADGYFDGLSEAEQQELMHGEDRREVLNETLGATNGVVADEEAAMELLNTISRRDWDEGLTIHSVVYNLTDKTVYWVGNEHYGDDAYTFHYSMGK